MCVHMCKRESEREQEKARDWVRDVGRVLESAWRGNLCAEGDSSDVQMGINKQPPAIQAVTLREMPPHSRDKQPTSK